MSTSKKIPLAALSELVDGQEADVFVLLASKQEATTRDGKPYWRVGFRDARREVNFPIWSDSAWAVACRDEWRIGAFYKVRGLYRETNYGPQLEIQKIRETTEADKQDGFDELMCLPSTQFNVEQMYQELLACAKEEIADAALADLVVDLLESNRHSICSFPAATRNHHAMAGGYLEHVLSVTHNAVLLADKYLEHYADMQPPLSRDLVIAGAILHDIGKLRELQPTPAGAEYTPQGELIGHVLLGRDMVREAAAGRELGAETLLRLEHIIVSHQRLPEWGSPKPPMTPEALLVHYADDIDAKLQIMYAALRDEAGDGALTSAKNALRTKVFRGLS